MSAQFIASDSGLPDDMEVMASLLSGRDLAVVFQPQVDIATGMPVGAEALSRWQHPRWGAVSPDRFIPRVDALGHSCTLFFRVLNASLEVLQQLSAQGLRLPISLNVPAQLISDAPWLERFEVTLAQGDIAPASVVIEMTETGHIRDMSSLKANAARLLSSGHGLAIDDFGIGISNEALLAEIPFTQLKLDRSFVAAIDTDDRRSIICRRQIALANALGIECVAEGVETPGQRQALMSQGCRSGQGYLWSPPVTAEGLGDFVSSASEKSNRNFGSQG